MGTPEITSYKRATIDEHVLLNRAGQDTGFSVRALCKPGSKFFVGNASESTTQAEVRKLRGDALFVELSGTLYDFRAFRRRVTALMSGMLSIERVVPPDLEETWREFHAARKRRWEIRASDTSVGGKFSGLLIERGSDCDNPQDWRGISGRMLFLDSS